VCTERVVLRNVISDHDGNRKFENCNGQILCPPSCAAVAVSGRANGPSTNKITALLFYFCFGVPLYLSPCSYRYTPKTRELDPLQQGFLHSNKPLAPFRQILYVISKSRYLGAICPIFPAGDCISYRAYCRASSGSSRERSLEQSGQRVT
jgi:hypothetical protein